MAKSKNMARVFVCGDVMLGRGIDQIQETSCEPHIFETYVKDARDYVHFAERRSGKIPVHRDPSYIWGDALAILDRYQPQVRLINLETSITSRGVPWPGKGIQYRMHPANVRLLQLARIDAVSLANNHVLDWSYEGLSDSLSALSTCGVTAVGAGSTIEAAATAARFPVSSDTSVIIYAVAHSSAGIPSDWGAKSERPGVNFVSNLDLAAVEHIVSDIERQRGSQKDIGIVSIHWGGNWGYEVPSEFRNFAQRLIDSGSVSLVHGHSSHHVKGFEIYKQRLILYGCGDFINDYEGIFGTDKDKYKSYLSFMYFVDFHPDSGNVGGLTLVPTRLVRLRVQRASEKESQLLMTMLKRELERFGGGAKLTKGDDGSIKVVL